MSAYTSRSAVLAFLLACVPSIANAAPSVGALTASPSVILLSTPSTVTITTTITDTSVIQNSVTLLRLNSSGQSTIVGQLGDGGINGDAVSGDHIYTIHRLPDSTAITNQYPGVTFSNGMILTSGISLNEFEFSPLSGVNVATDDGGPITIVFAAPTSSFGAYFTYLSPITLVAFDGGGSQVGSMHSAFANNLDLSGITGSVSNEFLTALFVAGIARVTVTGDLLGGLSAMDNVTIGATSSDTPEPSAGLMVCVGAALLAFHARRLRKRGSFGLRSQSLLSPKTPRLVLLVAPALVLSGISPVRAATPTVGAPVSTPSSLTVGANTPITVTSQISDASLIEGSVLLVQIGPSGSIIATLAQLNDGGSNGDSVAGDKIFTAITAVPDSVTNVLTLRVSAAFRGMLRRVLSDPVIVTIAPPQILRDPTTNVQITTPNFGVPAQLVFSQPGGEAPLLELKVQDPQKGTLAAAYGISLAPNPSRLSLQAWFSQHVDPDGILIASNTFVLRTLANGRTALLLVDAIPAAYQDGPVDDGYMLSQSGDTIVIVSTSHVNPLHGLGYSAAQIRDIAQRILSSVQM